MNSLLMLLKELIKQLINYIDEFSFDILTGINADDS